MLTPWYEDHDEVLALARHLIDDGSLPTPAAVLAFFEKPWKWEPEYQLWYATARPQGDPAHA